MLVYQRVLVVAVFIYTCELPSAYFWGVLWNRKLYNGKKIYLEKAKAKKNKNSFLDAKNNLQNKKLSIPHVSTYSMSGSEGLDQWLGVRENLQDTTPNVHQM